MTEVPQESGVTTRRGYGTFYSFAIPKAAQNPQGAYRAALVLSSPDVSRMLAEGLNFSPVRRGVITQGTQDPYRSVIYRAALIARGWLDPNPTSSENVFKQLIEDVTSGRIRTSDAVGDASERLQLLFK